jgi:hypothetical protein
MEGNNHGQKKFKEEKAIFALLGYSIAMLVSVNEARITFLRIIFCCIFCVFSCFDDLFYKKVIDCIGDQIN